jgi:hypothetical protein
MCLLIFSKNYFFCNVSYSKETSARCCRKCTNVFTYTACYSCQILMSLEFPPRIFEKFPNIKLHKNLSSGAEMFHVDQWTGRHDEAILRPRLKKDEQHCYSSHSSTEYGPERWYITLKATVSGLCPRSSVLDT